MFHSACLEPYLEDLITRQEIQLKCPHLNCGHSLPDSVVDSFPTLKLRFSELKASVLQAATTSKVSTTCPTCRSSVASSKEICVLRHGHKLCVKCYYGWWEELKCGECKGDMTSEDQTILMEFYEEMQKNSLSMSFAL